LEDAVAARGGAYGVIELRRDLAAKPPAPVYVVEGEESLLAEEAVGLLIEACVPAAARDFNYDVFAGDDEAARGFLAQAGTYPFMAERRLVVLRRFEKLRLSERDEAALAEYVKSPSPTTVLVLVATKLDRRTNLAKLLDRHARGVQAKELVADALPAWVGSRARTARVPLDRDAVQRLIDFAGPGLLELANEIDKLAVRYAGAKQVGAVEVEATVGAHRAEEVWAIHRAFRPDNCAGFMRALARVLETDDELVRLLAVLARHVNDLLRVRVLLDRGPQSPGALAKRLGRSPWQLEQQLPQARAFTRSQLLLWLRNLQRADVEMKSSPLPQRLVLERALVHSFMGHELA
jgi:DNA polymerase-3 subunit delta